MHIVLLQSFNAKQKIKYLYWLLQKKKVFLLNVNRSVRRIHTTQIEETPLGEKKLLTV